jgi:uncharacterized protein (DUF488 family)
MSLTSNEQPTLYTIGHSNLSADDFLSLLNTHHITTLVDVRSAPYSKYVPHFGKRELESFLTERSVNYRYAGEILGGRPKQAEVYKNNEVPDENTKREDFLKLVQYEEIMKQDWYQKAILHLLNIVRDDAKNSGRVAIMCSEGNPRECHRHHLIARSLIDPKVRILQENVEVCHILKDGTLETLTPATFETPKPNNQQLSLWGE